MRRTVASDGIRAAAGVLLIAAAAAFVPAQSSGASLCATKQLRITIAAVPGGLDHVGAAVRFRNQGSTCVLRGYPGVDGLVADGRAVVHATRSLSGYLGGAKALESVVLGHGKTASALYEGLGGPLPGHRCPNYRFLEITPPNETHSVRLRVDRGLCSPQIHPVVAGRTGSVAAV